MAYEHKPNKGTLFINDNREAETHAHWKGSAKIGGVDYWVNEWNVTTDRDGNRLSKDKYRKNLSFTEKDAQRAPATLPQDEGTPFNDSLDDINF